MRGTAKLVVCLVATTLATFTGCTCGGGPGQSSAFSEADGAKICATLEACFPTDWDYGMWGGSLSSCATQPIVNFLVPTPVGLGDPAAQSGLDGPLADVYRCVLAAHGDCKKAAACLAPTGGGGTSSPAASLESGTCTGKKLEGCSADGYGFDIDCSHYGEVCGGVSVFAGTTVSTCGLSSCTGSSQDSCSGTIATDCMGKIMVRSDCALEDATCTKAKDGTATCKGKTTCTTPGTGSCNGAVAIDCASNGTELRYDCARGPTMHRCASGGCVATGKACTLGGSEICEGSKIRYCADGYLKTVDCKALGFAGCAGGRCEPAASGGTCPTGYTDCKGTCADLSTDPANCNQCGNACPSGQTCQSGTCTDPGCLGSGCSYGQYCDQTTDTCKPGCASNADCAQNQVCGSSHTCACASTAHKCGSFCVLPGDPNACGPQCTVCPTATNANATCVGGTCGLTCVSGYHTCAQACVSDTDPATCGTRCSPCPAPPANGSATCVSGSCGMKCSSGYHLSGTSCVADCTSDASCGAGQYCDLNGSCSACPTGGNEVEPNNARGTATTMPAGTAASSWQGTGAACPTSDVDWWTVPLTSGGSAHWSASVPNGEIQVAIYDGNKYLTTTSCDTSTPCTSTAITLTGGVKALYLEVTDVVAPAGYTLDVSQP